MANPDDKGAHMGRNESKRDDPHEDLSSSRRSSDAIEYAKKKRWSRLVHLDKTVSWLLFVVTFLTILTGYMLTRVESQPVPAIYHVAVKVVFVMLFLFHATVVTVFIKYHWKTQILRIMERNGSEASVIKLIPRISGIFVLIFTVIVVVSGLDFYFNLENRSLLHGISEPMTCCICSLPFTWRAGLKVASGTAIALVVVFLVVLTGVFAAFETGYFMSSTTEAGNRMEIDGA